MYMRVCLIGSIAPVFLIKKRRRFLIYCVELYKNRLTERNVKKYIEVYILNSPLRGMIDP